MQRGVAVSYLLLVVSLGVSLRLEHLLGLSIALLRLLELVCTYRGWARTGELDDDAGNSIGG